MRLAPPTSEELAQYSEALAAGVDAETARAEIWPKRPLHVVLSLVDQDKLTPLVVGWTTCGHCQTHVSRCACANGPVEPAYIAGWRADPRAVSTPVETRSLNGRSYVNSEVVDG